MEEGYLRGVVFIRGTLQDVVRMKCQGGDYVRGMCVCGDYAWRNSKVSDFTQVNRIYEW